MPTTNISEKRLAANRANAARSTGPRTPEGKARAAQNSRKHGFTAANFIAAPLENAADLENLRDDATAFYQPINSQELFTVERIALAQLSLLRCSILEAGLIGGGFTSAGAVGLRVFAGPDGWKLFLRYRAQAERQYRRAVEEFERLKALREELPNEPNSDQDEESEQFTSPEVEDEEFHIYECVPPQKCKNNFTPIDR